MDYKVSSKVIGHYYEKLKHVRSHYLRAECANLLITAEINAIKITE